MSFGVPVVPPDNKNNASSKALGKAMLSITSSTNKLLISGVPLSFGGQTNTETLGHVDLTEEITDE